jgi:hypothetical protein
MLPGLAENTVKLTKNGMLRGRLKNHTKAHIPKEYFCSLDQHTAIDKEKQHPSPKNNSTTAIVPANFKQSISMNWLITPPVLCVVDGSVNSKLSNCALKNNLQINIPVFRVFLPEELMVIPLTIKTDVLFPGMSFFQNTHISYIDYQAIRNNP